MRTKAPLSAHQDKSFFFDAVRGLSAQLVLIGHALNVCFPSFFMQPGRDGLLEARAGLLFVQNLGVLVFFCISGFLITASVMRRKQCRGYDLTDYLLDRFARIFTPLLPLLLILFVVDNALATQGWPLQFTQLNTDPGTLLLNMTMLSDHAGMSGLARITGLEELRAGAFGTADQLWTVVVEWWIYVTFGVVAFAVIDKRFPSVAGVALLGFAVVVPAYLLLRGNGLIVAWIVGMMGALFYARLLSVARPVVAGVALVSGSIATLHAWSTEFDFYHPIFTAAFSVFLLAVHQCMSRGSTTTTQQGWFSWLCTGLSEVSYSVYLVHLSVLFWIVAWKPEHTETLSMLLALLVSANAVAVAFYATFERHHPTVRRHLARARSQYRSTS